MFDIKKDTNDIEEVKKMIEESFNEFSGKTQYYFLEGDNTLKLDAIDNIESVINLIDKEMNQFRLFSIDRELMVTVDKHLSVIGNVNQWVVKYNLRIIKHDDYSSELRRKTNQYIKGSNNKGGYDNLTLLSYIKNGEITEPIMFELKEGKIDDIQ